MRPSGKLDWHFVLYKRSPREAAAALQGRIFLSVDAIIQGGTLVSADDEARGYITLSEKILSDLGMRLRLSYILQKIACLIASV